ncbi:hypothetical protein PYH37_004820 [Sinorhizobium numidicum]|uniref:Lipoprotein n=1 Tax=Sinorhizobium numidicum TaxID=680248 RepID=A0ABY8D0U6_9HYPH|nr:hypothetical protein [Sinorhizobium numidicum]WEX76509.1 hypothetical protein PYH37_004820 [Sinorhizobium numidicum]WEX83170.1 hypothetical protein PYH38_005532 [Sinorhizobium numidicum]
MRKLIMPVASLGLAAAVAGCNSTDALIPQVDVGGGTFRSPPVTQSDLDAMSTQTAVMPVESVPPGRTAAFSAQPNIASPPPQYATGDVDYTDPAGTLEGQARRLAQGEAPVQNRQAESEQTPSETAQDGAVSGQPAVGEATATEPEETKQAAASPAAAGSGGIRFLPIIGAPVQAVTPLSKQLGAAARAEGLPIKSSTDTTSDHILKGYFSALNDGGKTTVVYVWDILDGSGNRLHRIQGQDTVANTAADPWSAVPPETMQAIASKTIEAYLEWRRASAG